MNPSQFIYGQVEKHPALLAVFLMALVIFISFLIFNLMSFLGQIGSSGA